MPGNTGAKKRFYPTKLLGSSMKFGGHFLGAAYVYSILQNFICHIPIN